VHQCARFFGAPKKEHAKALKWLGRYLIATRDSLTRKINLSTASSSDDAARTSTDTPSIGPSSESSTI
jgi:hypothetical protein